MESYVFVMESLGFGFDPHDLHEIQMFSIKSIRYYWKPTHVYRSKLIKQKKNMISYYDNIYSYLLCTTCNNNQ